MKFCKFVGSSYPHIFTNFYRFILIFHHTALIFPRVTHRFHPVKFWVSLFTQKMKMQLFENDFIFSLSRVSVSDNCKQSITVRFFTINVLLTLFWSLVGPTDGKIVLQRQTVHADAVADLPVPLFGLHRTAEPVWLTRLQTFWTVLNFHPLSGYAFSPSPCSRSICIQYSKLDTVRTIGTHGKINAIWWNIKINVQK